MEFTVRGLRRVVCRGGLAAALVAASLAGGTGSASAVVDVGSPVVGNPGFYNYTPTVILNGSTEDLWWCGNTADRPHTDTILHAQYSLAGGVARVTEPEQAVLEEGPTGTWDSLYTCNPDVVEGHFVNPLGNGVTYADALYYVGTSANNAGASIGVAFSNDGLTWVKYPTPVLAYTQPAGGTNYGFAQPNAYNPGGGSAVTLLYQVALTNSSENSNDMVTSTDGVHFSAPQTITSAGLPSPLPGFGGVAYDEQDGRWYAASDPAVGRPVTMTGGVGERGTAGFTLYATSNLFTGTWTNLTTIDTNLTGYEVNFLAGLLRQPDGALNDSSLPTVDMFVSASVPRPAWNATPAQAGTSADISNWRIIGSSWAPNNPIRGLYRYYDSTANTHDVTTGPGAVDMTAFHYEATLGDLYEAPTGAATVPWYACKAGTTDYFVSLDPNCEGQFYLGLEGYGYAQPGAGETALYRCYTGVDHFVSTDPNCEGKTTESLIGYAQTQP